jgi:amino acid transporter
MFVGIDNLLSWPDHEVSLRSRLGWWNILRPGFGIPRRGDAVAGGGPVASSEASVPAGAAKAAGTESSRLFIRQTSGLVRELGIPQANLGVINPTAYGKITSLNSVADGLGYGMVLSTDPITKIPFATAVPLAEIAVNLAFLTVATRVLFAQAFDRLLPVSVAKIGDRNHAPNVAISIVVVIGIGFCFLTSLVNLGSIVALQSLFFALILLAGGIAATVLPMRRADLIPTPGLPDDARGRWLRNVGLVGGATTVLALFTVYELIAHSSVYGKFSWESILTLVIVLGAGPVNYLIARTVRRQRDSLDLSMAMHELPPE